ncbi:MAG TPA: hypothetical protein PKE69_11285, partial [Pyrinomonadaceae bacterium]|nr:hypothetical protein [Pyrinomonadaceae bacterium]
ICGVGVGAAVGRGIGVENGVGVVFGKLSVMTTTFEGVVAGCGVGNGVGFVTTTRWRVGVGVGKFDWGKIEIVEIKEMANPIKNFCFI